MRADYPMKALMAAYDGFCTGRRSNTPHLLLPQVLAGLALTIALGAIPSPVVAASSDVTCEPNDVCRIVQTRLPLRALPRVNSNIFQEKDTNSTVVEANVPAFIPLYVFERAEVSYADPIRPTGWF